MTKKQRPHAEVFPVEVQRILDEQNRRMESTQSPRLAHPHRLVETPRFLLTADSVIRRYYLTAPNGLLPLTWRIFSSPEIRAVRQAHPDATLGLSYQFIVLGEHKDLTTCVLILGDRRLILQKPFTASAPNLLEDMHSPEDPNALRALLADHTNFLAEDMVKAGELFSLADAPREGELERHLAELVVMWNPALTGVRLKVKYALVQPRRESVYPPLPAQVIREEEHFVTADITKLRGWRAVLAEIKRETKIR